MKKHMILENVNICGVKQAGYGCTMILYFCCLLLFSHSLVSDSLWPHGLHSMPGYPVLHNLPEFVQTDVQWVGDAIQPSHSLLPSSLPAINLSQHQGLFHGLVLPIRLSKYWSFSFSISPFDEYSALISFRIDWFDLLAVQQILKSLFQHHNSKALILQHSAFLMVQLSHQHVTTGKIKALTIWASLIAQLVKNLPAMWETCVRSLGWEDPLEKEMATHSRTLAWKSPWMEEPGRLQSMGSQRVGHDWATSLHLVVQMSELGHKEGWMLKN